MAAANETHKEYFDGFIEAKIVTIANRRLIYGKRKGESSYILMGELTDKKLELLDGEEPGTEIDQQTFNMLTLNHEKLKKAYERKGNFKISVEGLTSESGPKPKSTPKDGLSVSSGPASPKPKPTPKPKDNYQIEVDGLIVNSGPSAPKPKPTPKPKDNYQNDFDGLIVNSGPSAPKPKPNPKPKGDGYTTNSLEVAPPRAIVNQVTIPFFIPGNDIRNGFKTHSIKIETLKIKSKVDPIQLNSIYGYGVIGV